jgi:hypothetical protein
MFVILMALGKIKKLLSLANMFQKKTRKKLLSEHPPFA